MPVATQTKSKVMVTTAALFGLAAAAALGYFGYQEYYKDLFGGEELTPGYGTQGYEMPPVPEYIPLSAGALIRSSGAVYYYAGNGMRYVFPDDVTYRTWYPEDTNFNYVTQVSEDQLASIQLGGNVTDRPGTTIIKINTDAGYYAVSRGGMLHRVDDISILEQLWGPYQWQNKVHEVYDGIFMMYSMGNMIASTSDYNVSDELNASPSIDMDVQWRTQGFVTPGYATPGYVALGPSDWDYWTPGYQPIGDWTPGYQPLASSAYVPQENDIVKGAGPALYLIGRDGRRYVYPNTKTYFTREMNFDRVRVITDAELRAIPIGGNVTYHPGSRMLKLTTDPRIYVVARGGVLRPLANESVAEAIYGPYWHLKVDDIPDGFFVNYRMGTIVNSAMDYNQANEWNGAGTFSDEFGM